MDLVAILVLESLSLHSNLYASCREESSSDSDVDSSERSKKHRRRDSSKKVGASLLSLNRLELSWKIYVNFGCLDEHLLTSDICQVILVTGLHFYFLWRHYHLGT